MRIIEKGTYNQSLKDANKAVRDAEAAYEARIISDEVVVLNRTGLREYLEKLENEMSPLKVVIGRGEPQSGKSHERYLFEKLDFENGAKPVYVYDGSVFRII